VKLLIKKRKTGLYNMVCQGVTSRLDVARELVKQLGINGEIKINEVSSDYFRREYFAPRPASERLINARLNQEGLEVMRDWKISLREYLIECYSQYLS
jgi:dTDP-4-dehydrorhamnose reductase